MRVLHTNEWKGERQKGGHWGGDLPSDIGHEVLERVLADLQQEGWDLSAGATKILMLTHRVLASEQGYASLPGVFRYNEAFLKKEHPHIAFLVDMLEPACDAYSARKYGTMFEILSADRPQMQGHAEKKLWSSTMTELAQLRETGTVGQVIDRLRGKGSPRLPDKVADRERELRAFDLTAGEPMPDALDELRKFRDVSYREIRALRAYLDGYSPFETKHGVKGAEFENVLVVLGRGWNRYNFGDMLELASGTVPTAKQDAFERNRNLFYVACSRPKRRLCLLFTQSLTTKALQTLSNWFGGDNVKTLTF